MGLQFPNANHGEKQDFKNNCGRYNVCTCLPEHGEHTGKPHSLGTTLINMSTCAVSITESHCPKPSRSRTFTALHLQLALSASLLLPVLPVSLYTAQPLKLKYLPISYYLFYRLLQCLAVLHIWSFSLCRL